METVRHPSELSAADLARYPIRPLTLVCGAVSGQRAVAILLEDWMLGFEADRTPSIVDGVIRYSWPLSDDLAEWLAAEPGRYQRIWSDSFGHRARRCIIDVTDLATP